MGRTGFSSARKNFGDAKMGSSSGFLGFPKVNINLNVFNNV
jgi:hypothetical protein